MDYPQNFINNVKEMYPDNQELHKALDEGNDTVGEYLKEGLETMVVTVKKEDLENGAWFLRCITRDFEKREELYIRWKNFFDFNK